jgi:hypothetical protein
MSWTTRWVVGNLGYNGRAANVVARAACGPICGLALGGQPRRHGYKAGTNPFVKCLQDHDLARMPTPKSGN